jgi:alkylresorcinol/alkylpyrone synthase
MPKIIGVTTAVPAHCVSQNEIKEFTFKTFKDNPNLNSLMSVFENAKVDQRYFSKSLEWFNGDHSFTEVNDSYIETAVNLAEKVVTDLVAQNGIKTTDFDVIFFISTTGLSTPSIDARLFNRIKLNQHIKRIPIWGLGCAGGAAGIARAHDYLKAYPKHRALVIALELCGLAFQKNDFSKSNIISMALFGDGAAACYLAGDEVKSPPSQSARPQTVASLSTIYPESEEVMSWRVTSEGFKVQLAKEIPNIVTSLVKGNVEELLLQNEVKFEAVDHFVMHPGGAKVIRAYSEGLQIPIEKLKNSSDVLREYGNMSSCTIYFVLKRALEQANESVTSYGLMASLGPGFSSELVLLKWN